MHIQIKSHIPTLLRTVRFWNNLHHVRLKSKDWKAKIIKKCLGAIKSKGPNRVVKIGQGHLRMPGENLILLLVVYQ